MLLGILGASLLEDLLTNDLSGKGAVRAGEGTIRAGSGIKKKALIPPHPLTSFKIVEYFFKNKPFNGVYSTDNLPGKTELGAYIVNLQDYLGPSTHWVALYIKSKEINYFDSFGVEHVPKEIKVFIGNKNTKTNIFRIQADNSIMRGFFCIGFIDFMFAGRSLINFTSSFSPYELKG